ncbi:MAG: metal-dependent hydrolase [Caldilinea sp.]|nr:DUF4184 family protein [Caldilinea sp.]MCB0057200.1 DUF4184 family protein [Caldilineaceae bacterium]MCB0049699.1 DUF4184 family protein [Caldilinea sp.]MCB0148666.1 DUF4184 family protein [Caldilineaceae bacterium]MCB9119719.1 DUF4184 family protein [Caldilineaceae bacterium]
MTAFAGDRLKKRNVPVSTKALLLGSVLPDLALFALTAWFIVYYRFMAPQGLPDDSVFGTLYDQLFFHNPIWIVGHNFFHAPLILAALGVAGYVGARQGRRWGWPLVWLMVGCGLHTVVDIFTHHNDGPLLLFPFDWQTRFAAPISYWDVRHGARVVAPLEHAMDIAIIVYLLWTWLAARRTRAMSSK